MAEMAWTRDRNESLSSREIEVLGMAALGLRNAEIAARMGLSVHAIKFHLAAVYRKLGVTNRTEAVVTYMRLTSAESEHRV